MEEKLDKIIELLELLVNQTAISVPSVWQGDIFPTVEITTTDPFSTTTINTDPDRHTTIWYADPGTQI